MKFKNLYKLIEQEIYFQYPGEDEELARDKVYSMQQFEEWFKKNESDLIWNEQAQGYDCNNNVKINYQNLQLIPIQFYRVKNNFSCAFNQLKSLKGCPKEVGGDFSCHFNKLVSLKYCPEIINGDFRCHNNKLTSLEYCPKEVKGDFYCSNNVIQFTEEQIRSICQVGGKLHV